MYYVIGARSSGKTHKIIVLRNHSMAVIVATIWLFVYEKKQQQILESQVCLNDAVAKSWRCFGFSLQPVSRHWKRLVNCALSPNISPPHDHSSAQHLKRQIFTLNYTIWTPNIVKRSKQKYPVNILCSIWTIHSNCYNAFSFFKGRFIPSN